MRVFGQRQRRASARLLTSGALAVLVGLVAGGLPAQAQTPPFSQTWVSGVGDDVNDCSRTAPCKTLAGAFSKTLAGGEIDVLDPGGFGGVTITKAITIDGSAALGSILASSSATAIIVNAGTSDIVVVRGMSLQGAGSGANGIDFRAGKALIIENTAISGFSGQGINFAPNGGGSLVVSNADIRNNSGSGILASSGGGVAQVTIVNTRFENNLVGINARSNSRVAVSSSVVTNNSTAGLQSQPDSGTAELDAEGVQSTLNGTGVNVGSGGTMRLSNVDAFNNTAGVSIAAGGLAVSFGNNRIAGNGSGNSPSLTTVPQQ